MGRIQSGVNWLVKPVGKIMHETGDIAANHIKNTVIGGIGSGINKAERMAKLGFEKTGPQSIRYPLGFRQKPGLTLPLIGLGIAAGVAHGTYDAGQAQRMGYVHNQGTLSQLGYDAKPQGDNTLGASGDLVFAMNKMR